MEPSGAHQFWGFSPALDLQQIVRTVLGPDDELAVTCGSGLKPIRASDIPPATLAEQPPLNILLVQPGDPRHIIKTISQRHRHSSRPLHFYVYEKQLEVLARELLLVALAFDWEIPIRQRANLWLEVFGNGVVQARTATYISSQLKPLLVDLLCSQKGPFPMASMIDFSLLKFKHRDELEEIFKGYDERVPFDMKTLRDFRLRHQYGTRYDFRNNLIDWDYQMAVKPFAGCVHYSQYRDWRNSGVAFEFGDQLYNQPNRTLASYVEGREKGRSKLVRGFWGDTVVSPYHAVSTTAYVPTADEVRAAADGELAMEPSPKAATYAPKNFASQLFEIQSRHSGSEQWRHHAVEIASYNLLSWLHEIEHGTQYLMPVEHDVYSGLKSHAKIRVSEDADKDDARWCSRTIAKAFQGVKVFLVSGDLEDLMSKHKLGTFDLIWLASNAVHFMKNKHFGTLLNPAATVITCETARNLPTLKREQQDEFLRRLLAMAGEVGAELVGSDRELSADTFCVGSSFGKEEVAEAITPEGFRFQPVAGRFCGIAKLGDASKMGAGERVKDIPMTLYSHLAPPSDSHSAHEAATKLQQFIRRIGPANDHRGDNPPPEAVVFTVKGREAGALTEAWHGIVKQALAAAPAST
jgi:dynein assembly factor 3